MNGKLLLTALLFTAACSSSGTKTETAGALPEAPSRDVAQTSGGTVEMKIDLPKALEYIKVGVGYEITCRPDGAHDTPITLSFPNYDNNTVMKAETKLLEFTRAVRDLGVKSINAGNTNYQTRYGSLYRMKNGEHVRVFNFANDLYGMCLGAGKKAANKDDVTSTDYDSSATIKSLVGPYASYLSSTNGYTEGAAHPWASVVMASVNTDDAKASGNSQGLAGGNGNTLVAQPVSLLKVVDNNSLAQALRADPFLLKRVGNSLKSAKDLKAIHKLLYEKLNDCDIFVDQEINDFMSHFAVYDYRTDGKVLVRLGMSYGCEAAHGTYTELGLVLTPTAEFKALLDEEMKTSRDEKRKPYFMKYMTKKSF